MSLALRPCYPRKTEKQPKLQKWRIAEKQGESRIPVVGYFPHLGAATLWTKRNQTIWLRLGLLLVPAAALVRLIRDIWWLSDCITVFLYYCLSVLLSFCITVLLFRLLCDIWWLFKYYSLAYLVQVWRDHLASLPALCGLSSQINAWHVMMQRARRVPSNNLPLQKSFAGHSGEHLDVVSAGITHCDKSERIDISAYIYIAFVVDIEWNCLVNTSFAESNHKYIDQHQHIVLISFYKSEITMWV